MVIEMMFRVAVIMAGFMDRIPKAGQGCKCQERPKPVPCVVGAAPELP